MRRCLGLVCLVLLFCFAFSEKVLASEINITNYPSTAVAGQEFEISFSASGVAVNKIYNIKGLGGENLTEVDTWNNVWLQQNAAWSKMPVFVTNPEGSASGKVKLRFDISASAGSKSLEVRIRNSDSDSDNLDSPSVMITLTVAPATPTPTQKPIFIQSPSPKPDLVTLAPSPTKSPLTVTYIKTTPKASQPPSPNTVVQAESVNILGASNNVATPGPENSRSKFPFYAIIFIVLGLILICLSIFQVYKKKNTSLPDSLV